MYVSFQREISFFFVTSFGLIESKERCGLVL